MIADDEVTLQFLKLLCKNNGLKNVVCVNSGEAALKEIRANQYGLFLLDESIEAGKKEQMSQKKFVKFKPQLELQISLYFQYLPMVS